MIILEGPDGSGKSTLAKKLDLPYYHFTAESTYKDFLKPLCSLELTNAVLDRCVISEYPYHLAMNRSFSLLLKEWHNLILLTLIQNPLIVLCTHKPEEKDYPGDQYLPYDKWDLCLGLYKAFFRINHIPYMEYDYAGPITPNALRILNDKRVKSSEWWLSMWKEGNGCIGSAHPKVLLVAERLGPNNVNNLPFEVGPTGHMLSQMLQQTHTPLGDFTVTNMVKSFRRDTRPPDGRDSELLKIEIESLKPETVVFMGTPARYGIRVAKSCGVLYETMVHFGYFNHKKKDVGELHEQWKKILGKE